MPLAKSKKGVGLGNALMKDRFGKGKGSDKRKASAIARMNHATGEQYLINEKQDASWVKMRSVTEQGDLDEFLATAELAGTDFVAEKMNNVEIIHTDQKNPYLLSAQEKRVVLGKHRIHKARLTVLRRPKWDASTTPRELDALERESFLNWRRGLSELQEHSDLLMTPFERNIEVWRQLWRVIERSDVIVQIVDARNPLLFRSEDLESYVTEVDANKKNLLLINKADMMTLRQRQAWAKYLKQAGVKYKFFSAHLAKELNASKDLESDSDDEAAPSSSTRGAAQRTVKDGSYEDEGFEDAGGGEGHNGDEETRILTVEELEDVLLQHAPVDAESGGKLQVGLVGYPNVGKSSTINALMGAKKVSVSSTPGKTKHFQTMYLSERVVLCDCPGLVFPNFALTKAVLVCNGVLPIDQMREYTGPVGLVTQRIPQRFLEAVYGIRIHTRPLEEGGTGVPTAEELLQAYAEARGFRTQGLGQPDQSRAARYLLKDYVNGKLLFVQPPPDVDDEQAFNWELYGQDHLPEARRSTAMALGRVPAGKDEDGREDAGEGDEKDEDDLLSVLEPDAKALPAGPKTAALDSSFFRQRGVQGHLKMPFSHRHAAHGGGDAGKLPSGRKARTLVALERGIDAKDVQLAASSKKHFKGGSRSAKGKKCRGVQLAAAQ